MAVIWGLDLNEIRWNKFKSSYMWAPTYHLRRTKFIIYQLAMIFCVVSESLGTAALSDYVDQQDYAAKTQAGAEIHNDDYVGAASYNIFAGVFVATIFGAAFFFDLFWPERSESPSVKLAWRICAIIASIAVLGSALTLTIITAMHSAYFTGTAPERGQQLLDEYAGSPLEYRHNGRAVAAVVFLWPGTIFTWASTYLLWKSYAHNDKFGAKSTHARKADEEAAAAEKSTAGFMAVQDQDGGVAHSVHAPEAEREPTYQGA